LRFYFLQAIGLLHYKYWSQPIRIGGRKEKKRGLERNPKREENSGEGHYSKPYKKTNYKKDIKKKEGARPNPRLAVAAPSPSFFTPLLPPVTKNSQSKPFVVFLFLSSLRPKLPPRQPWTLLWATATFPAMVAERECPLQCNGPNRQLFLTSTTTSHRVYELLLP